MLLEAFSVQLQLEVVKWRVDWSGGGPDKHDARQREGAQTRRRIKIWQRTGPMHDLAIAETRSMNGHISDVGAV